MGAGNLSIEFLSITLVTMKNRNEVEHSATLNDSLITIQVNYSQLDI